MFQYVAEKLSLMSRMCRKSEKKKTEEGSGLKMHQDNKVFSPSLGYGVSLMSNDSWIKDAINQHSTYTRTRGNCLRNQKLRNHTMLAMD